MRTVRNQTGRWSRAIIALSSASLIGLELAWTRIFSAEFFYTFAFLILSLAILGLGLGALALRLFPALGRERLLGAHLVAAGLATLVSPILVFRLGLDFSLLFSSAGMIGKFLLTIMLLSAPFFFGGAALALLFKRSPGDMPRLYMADLVGAGAGVVIFIWLMNRLETPAATFIAAIPILLAAVLVGKGWPRVVPAGVVVVAIVLSPHAKDLLEANRTERAPVIYKHWDAMAKIKVFDYEGEARGINIDNVANSPVHRFDGAFDDPGIEESTWGIDVSYLIRQFDECAFLSLGAGGGGDVLQALVEGATIIHAVEVNPHINKMMVDGDPSGYIESSRPSEGEMDGEPVAPPVIRDEAGEIITTAAFSGYIYRDPRVRVVSEDARAYVRRHRNTFDVIYSLSSNTWAALGSGSFAFAESYLFTTEAFRDYWEALTDEGFLSMEHQVYMPRLVSALIDALEGLGVEDPASHFAVYALPEMRRQLLLVSKRPLTDEIRQMAYGELTPENFDSIHLLFPSSDGLEDNLINRIVVEGWQTVADSAPVDISPSTDDRPFVAQMGLWRNFDWKALEKVSQWADFRGFPLSKGVIVIILLCVGLLVLPLNLVPYFRKGEHLRAVPWLFFFTIGMAFMCVEIVLIQKYALFIGAPIYSIATVLLALLIASGIGSRFSDRVGDGVAFAGIVFWILLEAFVLVHVTETLGGLTVLMRTLITGLLIAPLGFFMGMPFPKGALRVGALVDWGFAVNGAASVLGATAVVMIAFTFGFTAALVVSALLYALAYCLISLRPAWKGFVRRDEPRRA